MLHAKIQSSHYDFICIFIFVSLGAKVEYIYCHWLTQSKYISLNILVNKINKTASRTPKLRGILR